MKSRTLMIAGLLMTGAGRSTATEDRRKVTVQLQNAQLVPFPVLARAQGTAKRIFAEIDVTLQFRSGADRLMAVVVQFDTRVSAEFHPDALAYAEPYSSSGTRVHVLLERVLAGRSADVAGALLGHVLAHELAHVLERMSRHSDSGVMKAHWSDADYGQMSFRPLSFDAADVEWIHEGLERRLTERH
jgi:hypothetical protein